MITQAEPTGAGLKAMTETGGMSLSFAYEPGRASILITNAGCAPMEIPVPLGVLRHLATVATETEANARLAAEIEGAEPMVPRNARASLSAAI